MVWRVSTKSLHAWFLRHDEFSTAHYRGIAVVEPGARRLRVPAAAVASGREQPELRLCSFSHLCLVRCCKGTESGFSYIHHSPWRPRPVSCPSPDRRLAGLLRRLSRPLFALGSRAVIMPVLVNLPQA